MNLNLGNMHLKNEILLLLLLCFVCVHAVEDQHSYDSTADGSGAGYPSFDVDINK